MNVRLLIIIGLTCFLQSTLLASFIYDFLDRCALIFDVGAHHGLKTDLYLQHGCGQVVQFEPQPREYLFLKKKYKNDCKVISVPYAISDANTQIDFYICKDAPTISTCQQSWREGRFKNEQWSDPIKVQAITLDDAIDRYGLPYFCKIDVEGFEKNVLLGLHQKIPIISFEFTQEFFSNSKECLHLLESLGYSEFNVALEEQEFFYSKDWLSYKNFTALMNNLIKSNPLLWGDIYAK